MGIPDEPPAYRQKTTDFFFVTFVFFVVISLLFHQASRTPRAFVESMILASVLFKGFGLC